MSSTVPNAKTVRLSKGRHPGPEDGACVMELSSMLAGGYFTDSPRSVCPMLAAFMRAYNDAVDDRTRQRLYPWAAQAIGTRAHVAVGDAREQLLVALAEELDRRTRSGWKRTARSVPNAEAAGALAARAVRRRPDLHQRVDDVLVAIYLCTPSMVEVEALRYASEASHASAATQPAPDVLVAA